MFGRELKLVATRLTCVSSEREKRTVFALHIVTARDQQGDGDVVAALTAPAEATTIGKGWHRASASVGPADVTGAVALSVDCFERGLEDTSEALRRSDQARKTKQGRQEDRHQHGTSHPS